MLICGIFGLMLGSLGGLTIMVVLFLMHRKLASNRISFPKAELTTIAGLPIFVGGIGWGRPLLIAVNDPLCNTIYFLLAFGMLVILSAREAYRLIVWCGRHTPKP
jgi:hypothetical protein